MSKQSGPASRAARQGWDVLFLSGPGLILDRNRRLIVLVLLFHNQTAQLVTRRHVALDVGDTDMCQDIFNYRRAECKSEDLVIPAVAETWKARNTKSSISISRR